MGLVDSRLFVSPLVDTFSARRFSRVPRSVLPASSSERRPDILRSDSMRPSRFSRPSIYFALCPSSECMSLRLRQDRLPFRWIPLLFHLCKYAFCFVVYTVRARGHPSVTLDLHSHRLAAAETHKQEHAAPSSFDTCRMPIRAVRTLILIDRLFPTHSRDSPSLRIILIDTPLLITIAEDRSREDRLCRRAVGIVGAKDLGWLRHEVGRHLEAVSIAAII